jgi:hypothetical protein
VDHAVLNHVSRPLSIGLHVRGGCVRFERFRARPFLDHNKGVWPKLGLGGAECRKINNGDVLYTTFFGTIARNSRSTVSRIPGFAVI